MVSCMNSILVQLNELAVTTFGIYYKLQYFVYMAVSGISQGTMPLISYFYGANDKKKFKDTVNYSVILTVIIGIVCMGIFMVIPNLIMSMFYSDVENIDEIYTFLRIAALSFVFGGVNYILASYFQSIQHGFKSLLIAVLRQFVLILPAAFLLSLALNEKGVYLAIPISELLTMLIIIPVFIKTNKKISMVLQ